MLKNIRDYKSKSCTPINLLPNHFTPYPPPPHTTLTTQPQTSTPTPTTNQLTHTTPNPDHLHDIDEGGWSGLGVV